MYLESLCDRYLAQDEDGDWEAIEDALRRPFVQAGRRFRPINLIGLARIFRCRGGSCSSRFSSRSSGRCPSRCIGGLSRRRSTSRTPASVARTFGRAFEATAIAA